MLLQIPEFQLVQVLHGQLQRSETILKATALQFALSAQQRIKI